MRITNSMMSANFMSNLNRNMSLMATYQDQLSSGKRITRLSDDPIGVMSVLGSRSRLAILEQHNSAIGDATSWLDQTDTSLQELNTVLGGLYDSAMRASNGTLADSDRQAIREYVAQMKAHIVQIGNATYGGKYIFGGYNTTQPPFQTDASGNLLYNGVNLADPATPAAALTALAGQTIEYATGSGITTQVSITGVSLMGTGADNLYEILDQFETALSGASTSALGAFVGQFQKKQEDVLSLLADVGGRQNRLAVMSDSNAGNEISYTAELSRVEDIDQALITMQFKMAEAVYRSALNVGARVIQPTLLDFLR